MRCVLLSYINLHIWSDPVTTASDINTHGERDILKGDILPSDTKGFRLYERSVLMIKTYLRAAPFPPVQLLNRAPYRVFFWCAISLPFDDTHTFHTYHEGVLKTKEVCQNQSLYKGHLINALTEHSRRQLLDLLPQESPRTARDYLRSTSCWKYKDRLLHDFDERLVYARPMDILRSISDSQTVVTVHDIVIGERQVRSASREACAI